MITMYGADWCGDCRRAKHYFDRHDVPYVYVDVAADPQEMDTVLRYNAGRRSIPVVVFPDGSHLTEPTDADLAAKLTG
jgi:mycoredoxin